MNCLRVTIIGGFLRIAPLYGGRGVSEKVSLAVCSYYVHTIERTDIYPHSCPQNYSPRKHPLTTPAHAPSRPANVALGPEYVTRTTRPSRRATVARHVPWPPTLSSNENGVLRSKGPCTAWSCRYVRTSCPSRFSCMSGTPAQATRSARDRPSMSWRARVGIVVQADKAASARMAATRIFLCTFGVKYRILCPSNLP